MMKVRLLLIMFIGLLGFSTYAIAETVDSDKDVLVRGYLERAYQHRRAGENDEAFGLFNKVLEIDPENGSAFVFRASLKADESTKYYNMDEALKETLQGIEYTDDEPTLFSAYINYAHYQENLKEEGEALDYATKALQLRPKSERAMETYYRLYQKVFINDQLYGLDRMDEQQNRYDKILERWETQQDRFDKILDLLEAKANLTP